MVCVLDILYLGTVDLLVIVLRLFSVTFCDNFSRKQALANNLHKWIRYHGATCIVLGLRYAKLYL